METGRTEGGGWVEREERGERGKGGRGEGSVCEGGKCVRGGGRGMGKMGGVGGRGAHLEIDRAYIKMKHKVCGVGLDS